MKEQIAFRAEYETIDLNLVECCQQDFSFSKVKERGAFWILVLLWADSLMPLVEIR